MVVLRSSLELHSRSAASSSDSLDLSSEFLSLKQMGRRRRLSAGAAKKPAVPATAKRVSTGGDGVGERTRDRERLPVG